MIKLSSQSLIPKNYDCAQLGVVSLDSNSQCITDRYRKRQIYDFFIELISYFRYVLQLLSLIFARLVNPYCPINSIRKLGLKNKL